MNKLLYNVVSPEVEFCNATTTQSLLYFSELFEKGRLTSILAFLSKYQLLSKLLLLRFHRLI